MQRPLLNIISIICLVMAFIASIYFYAHFPEMVATHWNVYGNPNGYSSRTFAAFFFPTLNLGIFLLLTFIPYIDPHRERYQEFAKTYNIFKLLIILFLTIIYLLIGLKGIGYDISVRGVVPLLVGIMFMIIGNYMSKIKSNWFFGIRTPWTLSSEEVWNKTHRLGGRLFVLVGLVMLLGALFPAVIQFWSFIILLVIVILITIVYSYIVYKKAQTGL